MDVKLTYEESLLLNGILMAGLFEKGQEVSPQAINEFGAKFAVAKMINVYPRLDSRQDIP